MFVPDGGGSAPVDLVEIGISIEAIEDLANFLTQQLTENIAPVTSQVIQEHHDGQALLGPDRSLIYLNVKSQYDNVTAADVNVLNSYVDATMTMATAMRTLAGVYRDADSMANATLDDVIAAFDQSWAGVQKAELARQAVLEAVQRVEGAITGITKW